MTTVLRCLDPTALSGTHRVLRCLNSGVLYVVGYTGDWLHSLCRNVSHCGFDVGSGGSMVSETLGSSQVYSLRYHVYLNSLMIVYVYIRIVL